MSKKIIVKAFEVDSDGNELSAKIISTKDVLPPTSIADFGYNQEEQLKMLEQIQQSLLDSQADFLKSVTE